MRNRRIGRLLIGMAGVLLAALAVVEMPARAQPPTLAPMDPATVSQPPGVDPPTLLAAEAGEIGGGALPQGGAPRPPLPPGPVADDGDGAEDEDDDAGSPGDSATVTVVERHTIWRILFPYETLGASIRAALGELALESARELGAQAADGISAVAQAALGETGLSSGIRDVRRGLWQVGIVIAGILMPLSFMASVVAALKDGTLSVTGYASAREALLNWAIAVGAAASSYFILSQGIELSGAATAAVFERALGTGAAQLRLGDYFVGLVVETAVVSRPGIAQIFLAVFGMLLALAFLASIGLALLAREVILMLAVGVAPVLLILGGVAPLRWLSAMWMKVTIIALLLGPANAFLIGGSALLALNARQSLLTVGGTGARLVGYLVALGIVSVLIGLNTVIGKMVYGAAIEIAQKAWNGLMVVGGALLAAAAGGLVGGAGLAASAGGATGASAAASSAGGASFSAQASSAARAVSSIGQAVAATGLPGGRGLAAGMNAGASVSAHRQIKQGIAEASGALPAASAAERWENRELSMRRAVDTAAGGIQGELEGSGVRGVLASSGISPASAWSRVSAARAAAHSMLSVGERHGVDVLAGLRQMGIRGGVAQEAGVEYARAMMKGVALGAPPPHTPISYRSLPAQVTLRDMDTAMRILGSVQPVGPDSVPSVALLDGLVQSVHQRRIQLKEDPLDTIRHAERAARLDRWMMDTYRQLPNPGLAAGLRKALGL